MAETVIKITLVVKGDEDTAREKLAMSSIPWALANWYAEDIGKQAPFRQGALLTYSTGDRHD